MKKYTVNTNITMNLYDEFYGEPALTLEGLYLNSLDDYANYLDNICGLENGAVFHVIHGNEMNDFYTLSGKNAYPDDLNIVVIKLSNLVDPNKIILKRFEFGGRWFDDVVDNNASRKHKVC